MKFPGRRQTKHYFPINNKGRNLLEKDTTQDGAQVYVVGLDQLLVDIEIDVTDEFLEQHRFPKGQSFLVEDELADLVYAQAKSDGLIRGEYPGGAIGNTLHNFSILSDSRSVALGSIKKHIEVGDYAYKYLCKTSGLVDLSYLAPSDKPMGRALCFITPDSERTFAISKGCMNDLSEDSLPVEVIENCAALLLSAYTLRGETDPVYHASVKASQIAKKADVPVVLSLGTSDLVEQKREFLLSFIKENVSVVAMNMDEAKALTQLDDPLLILELMLDYCDMALLTVGAKGLYLASYSDDSLKRHTKEPLVTKSLVNYNQYEYSRSMRKKSCQSPVKIYTHINPFQGGPLVIKNTNGAGDAALAALMHDMAANRYHRDVIPTSPKHEAEFLTYSSISQISKYANRVSFEVLTQSSPRLFKGLPQKENTLDDAYWRK